MHVVQEEQDGWYEASLSLQERRKRGHFSTPPLLVERILDACGYTPDNDLRSLRILDPACGSGNFLVAAARRLVSYASNNSLSRQECAALVQGNVWGFDPDPVSCFLAEMQLSAALAGGMASNRPDSRSNPRHLPAPWVPDEFAPTNAHAVNR